MSATSPFSPEQQKAFDAAVSTIFPKYPPENREAALIPVLHAAQDQLGWLPPQALDYVAEVIGVPGTRVREVVTFYSLLHTKPVGEKHVGVCVNIGCWLRGSDKLVDFCRNHIGAEQNKPTADGKYSWSEVECLASCGTAPVAMINETYFESVTVEQLDRELGPPSKTDRK